MDELIDRQAAIDALQKEINKGIPPFDDVMGSIRCGVRLARNIIEDLPSVQPKERCIAKITLSEEDLEKIAKEQVEEIKELLPQKGEWIWDDDTFDLEKEYICGECRCYALKKDGNQIRSNFCPNCGCRMEEGDLE